MPNKSILSAGFILINGEITNDTIHQVSEEIDWICLNARDLPAHKPHELGEIVFMINSNGGACNRDLFDLIRKIQSQYLKTRAIIVNASSAAAMIALSCDSRQIKMWGKLIIHDGEIKISAAQKNGNTLLPYISSLLDETKGLTRELLNSASKKIPQPKLVTLETTGVLNLEAADCIAYGIAEDYC